jgi:hypothetical protein
VSTMMRVSMKVFLLFILSPAAARLQAATRGEAGCFVCQSVVRANAHQTASVRPAMVR